MNIDLKYVHTFTDRHGKVRKEVERYTRAAERARMARNANKKVARAFSSKTTIKASNGKLSSLGLPTSSITY